MQQINVNAVVSVRLTEHGRRLLMTNHAALWAGRQNPPAFRAPQEDADGWSRWQLWDLMREFGPYMGLGLELPFEATVRLNGATEAEKESA